MHRFIVAVTAAGCLLAAASTAQATQTPDQILRALAAKQTHSWTDNHWGSATLLARYRAGYRLNITCGYVSEVARRLLRDTGYRARRAAVITDEEPNGMTDGHVMVEVFYQGRWQLYDVDANRRATTAAGAGVSLAQQIAAVKAGTARWVTLAYDPLYRADEPDPVLRQLAADLFADPTGFYRRVMGFELLPRDYAGSGVNGWYYDDASQTARVEQYWPAAGYELAGQYTWTRLAR